MRNRLRIIETFGIDFKRILEKKNNALWFHFHVPSPYANNSGFIHIFIYLDYIPRRIQNTILIIPIYSYRFIRSQPDRTEHRVLNSSIPKMLRRKHSISPPPHNSSDTRFEAAASIYFFTRLYLNETFISIDNIIIYLT